MALLDQQIKEIQTKYGLQPQTVQKSASRFDSFDTAKSASRFDYQQKNKQSNEGILGGDKTLLDYGLGAIQGGVDLYEKAAKFTGIPQAVGKAVSLPGYAIGGAIGGIGETGLQTYNALKGGNFDINKIKESAIKTAKETGQFGETIGTEGTVAAPFAGLGKIPSAILAAPTLYEGIKEKDPTKLAIGAISLFGAKNAKGKFLEPEVKALGQKGLSKITGGIIPPPGGGGFNLSKTNKIVDEAIDKGVKPGFSKLTSTKQRSGYYNKARQAFQTIREEQPQFTDEAGQMVVRPPQNRAELLDGLGQAKESVYHEYSALAKESGDIGAQFDAQPTIKKLNTVVGDKKYSPETRAYAEKLAQDLGELHGESPIVVQERIKDLNNSLGAFYDGRVSKAKAQIDASAANALREQLDNQISGLTNSNYQGLKNKYGALLTIEKDVARQAAIEARKNPKSLLDFTDIFTGGDLSAGILTMNPALIAKGAAARGFKEYFKWVNDPNRYIKNAFEHLYSIPYEKPPRIKTPISGLLGPGPMITPLPKDTSGIIHNAPLPYEAPMAKPLELPEGVINLPAKGILQGQANIKQPKVLEGVILPKTSYNEYTQGSKKVADVFNKSTGQKNTGNLNGRPFSLGEFGGSHQERKLLEQKFDRFNDKELPDTIKNIVSAFRSSNDPTAHRFDNISWVSVMPNGETRIVYTRLNRFGSEEIVGWHKLDETKKAKYLDTLASFGKPDQNRTGMYGLEVH